MKEKDNYSENVRLLHFLKEIKEDCGMTWQDISVLSDLTASFLVQVLKGRFGLGKEQFNKLSLLVEFLKENAATFKSSYSRDAVNSNKKLVLQYLKDKFNATNRTTV